MSDIKINNETFHLVDLSQFTFIKKIYACGTSYVLNVCYKDEERHKEKGNVVLKIKSLDKMDVVRQTNQVHEILQSVNDQKLHPRVDEFGIFTYKELDTFLRRFDARDQLYINNDEEYFYCTVMEYLLESESLAQLQQQREFSTIEARSISRHLQKLMAPIWNRGVSHGDFALRNVMAKRKKQSNDDDDHETKENKTIETKKRKSNDSSEIAGLIEFRVIDFDVDYISLQTKPLNRYQRLRDWRDNEFYFDHRHKIPLYKNKTKKQKKAVN
jgi:hypothetical protein